MPAYLLKQPFQFSDSNGLPVTNGTVEFYEPNGSSTPKAVYSDKSLTTSAGTSATLNALGMFNTELYGNGDYYIIVKYADASTAYDMEYIEGEGSGNNAATEWVESVTPTYIGATSFSVPGDLTSDFHANRRVKTENTGGTVYSTIVSSVFSSVTTVTVVNDSGTLDSGLSSVELGFLRADNSSEPRVSVVQENVSNNVNKVTVTNAATGNDPTVAASGGDTSVALLVEGKGNRFARLGGRTVSVSGSATDSLTISNIEVPADAVITGSLFIPGGVNPTDPVFLEMNGDTTTANYEYSFVENSAAGASGNAPVLTTLENDTNDRLWVDFRICQDSTSGTMMMIASSVHYDSSAANTKNCEVYTYYSNGGALTSLKAKSSTGALSFVVGSHMTIKVG